MWFSKKRKDIEFVDTSRNAYLHSPIIPAKKVPIPFADDQRQKHGKYKPLRSNYVFMGTHLTSKKVTI